MRNSLLTVRDIKIQFGGVVALVLPRFDLQDSDGISGVFIGANGAGKTTMLNALTGYVPIGNGGQVTFVNREVRHLAGLSPAAIVKAGVARTFQTPCLFESLTVGQVLSLAFQFGRGDGSADQAGAVHRVVEMVGIRFNLRLRQGTAELSLADARRLDLARALMSAPRLLMLDEPTAGLSEGEKESLIGILNQAPQMIADVTGKPRRSLTIALVTHDIRFLSTLQERLLLTQAVVTFLSQGRVVEQGTLAAVTNTKLVREAYFGD